MHRMSVKPDKWIRRMAEAHRPAQYLSMAPHRCGA